MTAWGRSRQMGNSQKGTERSYQEKMLVTVANCYNKASCTFPAAQYTNCTRKDIFHLSMQIKGIQINKATLELL